MDLETMREHLETRAKGTRATREINRTIENYVFDRLKIDPRWHKHSYDGSWVYPPRLENWSIDEKLGTVEIRLEARACGCGCSGYDSARFEFPLRHLWEEFWEQEIKAEVAEIERTEDED